LQDGSCNGLQHYAALGRDQKGAESVNVAPSAYPQDVYTDTAEAVDKLRRIDAERGIKIAQILEGYITRKVRKVFTQNQLRTLERLLSCIFAPVNESRPSR